MKPTLDEEISAIASECVGASEDVYPSDIKCAIYAGIEAWKRQEAQLGIDLAVVTRQRDEIFAELELAKNTIQRLTFGVNQASLRTSETTGEEMQ